MHTNFIISFKTYTYDDAYIIFRIPIQNGQDLHIPVSSRRELPLLTGIIYYGPCTGYQLYQLMAQDSPLINKVLNSTIDCKSVLIGTTNKLIIYSCKQGADSSFFLVSEYSWYNMVINVSLQFLISLFHQTEPYYMNFILRLGG